MGPVARCRRSTEGLSSQATDPAHRGRGKGPAHFDFPCTHYRVPKADPALGADTVVASSQVPNLIGLLRDGTIVRYNVGLGIVPSMLLDVRGHLL